MALADNRCMTILLPMPAAHVWQMTHYLALDIQHNVWMREWLTVKKRLLRGRFGAQGAHGNQWYTLLRIAEDGYG